MIYIYIISDYATILNGTNNSTNISQKYKSIVEKTPYKCKSIREKIL